MGHRGRRLGGPLGGGGGGGKGVGILGFAAGDAVGRELPLVIVGFWGQGSPAGHGKVRRLLVAELLLVLPLQLLLQLLLFLLMLLLELHPRGCGCMHIRPGRIVLHRSAVIADARLLLGHWQWLLLLLLLLLRLLLL